MARTVGMIPTRKDAPVERPVCPHCGKEFKSLAALRTHVKKEHPDMLDETGPSEEQE